MKALLARIQLRFAAALAALRRRTMPGAYAALELATSSWISYALAAFCELGLPQALQSAPKSAVELSAMGFGDAQALARLLRSLAAYDVVYAAGGGRYGLGHSGKALADADSLAPMIRYANAPWHAAAYHELAQGVRDGRAGFEHAHGRKLFDYLSVDPQASALFDAAMRAMSGLSRRAFVDAYRFNDIATIVDVGGGDGALMQAVLARYPRIHAYVFDLPHVVRNAAAPGITFVPGDIFSQPPPPADGYVLSHVLHDWPDDACVKILSSIQAAMRAEARLLVYEMVVDERRGAWSPDRVSDVEMLAMLGGKERTRAEFESLFRRSGLRMRRLCHAAAPESVIECVRDESPAR